MGNTLISYPDKTLAATLSTGSWNSSYPLTNLKDPLLSKVARSVDDAEASTKFVVSLAALSEARVIALLNHNISLDGTVRVRGYLDAGLTDKVPGADNGSENKCTCYGVPRVDSYEATQGSGIWLATGFKYEIVTRATLDFTLAGSLNNTVGTQFVCSAMQIMGAGDSVRVVTDGVGTKSYHDGTAWRQRIPNMTLSGDTAAVLSIVTDQAAIDAAGLTGMVNGGKVYKLDNSLGVGAAYLGINGTTGNANQHSFSCYIKGAVADFYLFGAAGSDTVVNNSSGYTRIKITTASTVGIGGLVSFYASPGQVFYFLLPQLEEQPVAGPIIPTYGAAVTYAPPAWPTAFTAQNVADYPKNWTFIFPSLKFARYWLIEIADTTNPDGYVQLGRCWIGPVALEPTVGIPEGAQLGYESRTITDEAIGGTFWHNRRTPRRSMTITLPRLTAAEKQTTLIMQKTLDTSGEFMFIRNKSDTAQNMLLQAFPAVSRKLSPLKLAVLDVAELPMEIVEII